MEIKFSQIILQLINFSILLFVLSKFLYRPILKIIEERASKVKEGLQAAQDSLAEKAKIEEKKKQALIESEKEAAAILEAAYHQAEQSAKDIIRKSREEAKKAARKEYEIIHSRLQEEEIRLRQRLAQLVTETTKTILRETLSREVQQKIISKQIQHLAKRSKK